MVTNRVGPPVRGTDFFDRENEQRRIWDYLHRDHLLLLAPRRVGKTSLMLRLADAAREKGFGVAYCSVADAADERGFVVKLLRSVREADGGEGALDRLADGPVGRWWRRVRRLEVWKGAVELEPEEEWRAFGESLARALDRESGRWLLLVDELPLFVLNLIRLDESGTRARGFLSWFRSLRQHADLQGGLRWLVAGSIGLDTVTARLNAGDTINDFHLIHLGAFSEEAADRLLRELSQSHSFPLSGEVRRTILGRVGWLIPFHLQLVFAELRVLCGERTVAPSPVRVDEVFDRLLAPAKKGYFDYWRQRLGEELGKPDGGFALLLLNRAAADEAGASRETLSQALAGSIAEPVRRAERLRYLTDVLVGDGYLVEVDGRLRFRSPLLRSFWLQRVAP